MTDRKMQQVIKLALSYKEQYGGREFSADDIEEMVNADWDNQDEHNEWLENADAKEIADWVYAGLK